ncbi:hypothetical protein NX02_11415 [Sphingomonas sanxanigenens DSM 19645 = NX02]|uniref:Uncharacterized protein n=1 Tax=Sphingomonas sanxanigenens DSM 19645 = NX02 TaxID=1123269 RepID=W0A7W1_9SPHN|nr:hypothetical protein NX02_11415 [Sphingomonas sanxanigenens DSM 19645 = NX02]
MTGYACWFCAQTIERIDAGAVIIVVEGLWRWADGTRTDDDPSQSIYAHAACAKDRLRGATRTGATMTIEPHIFGEE